MTDYSDASPKFPTPRDVRLWKEELRLLKQEEEKMKARHAAEEGALKFKRTRLDKLIAAAEAFAEATKDDRPGEPELPDIIAPAPSKPAEPEATAVKRRHNRGAGKSWTETMLQIILNSEVGLSYADLKSEVGKTHLGETLQRTEKALYGGIAKLDKAGKIVRYRAHVFSPEAFEKFKADVAAGRVADLPKKLGGTGESDNEIAVRRFLEGRPRGATTSEIVSSLLDHPPADLNVTTNKNSIYNLISRQRKQGKIIQRGELNFLARKDEAPDSEESGAPSSNGGGDGTSSSSGGNGSGFSFAAYPGANPAQRPGGVDPEIGGGT